MLSTALGIFQVCNRSEIRERYLFQKTRLGGVLVQREKVGTEDEVEGSPLLMRTSAPIRKKRDDGILLHTLVLRVRFFTSPLFSTRSKAKLPFWLTAESVSRFR